MGKRGDRARASKLGDGGSEPEVATTVAPLRCPTCSAPVPLGDGEVAACTSCGAQVPLPDAYRAMRDAEHGDRADRAAAEALYQKLGSRSRALGAWAAFTALAGGAVLAISVALVTICGALIFLAGFALELVLHWIAPLIRIDLIDRFGGGTVYVGFEIGGVAFALVPI